jgi:hypothetical protein
MSMVFRTILFKNRGESATLAADIINCTVNQKPIIKPPESKQAGYLALCLKFHNSITDELPYLTCHHVGWEIVKTIKYSTEIYFGS